MSKSYRLPQRAWAIMDSDDTIAIYDHRLPLCWNRGVAEREREDKVFDGRVVRVEIREVRRKRRPQ